MRELIGNIWILIAAYLANKTVEIEVKSQIVWHDVCYRCEDALPELFLAGACPNCGSYNERVGLDEDYAAEVAELHDQCCWDCMAGLGVPGAICTCELPPSVSRVPPEIEYDEAD